MSASEERSIKEVLQEIQMTAEAMRDIGEEQMDDDQTYLPPTARLAFDSIGDLARGLLSRMGVLDDEDTILEEYVED